MQRKTNECKSLSGKTIFDFCDDTDVLRFITGQENPSRRDYVKVSDRDDVLSDLSMLVFITEDDELSLLVSEVFPYIIEWDISVLRFAEEYWRKRNKDAED